MSWNGINTFGLVVMIFILIPNIIYAYRTKHIKDVSANNALNILEQVGRYGSMFLMIFSIGVGEFGFASEESFVMWIVGIPTLLVLYWGAWVVYFVKTKKMAAILLAVIPCVIFILSGILLSHWLLVVFGSIFAVAHVVITYEKLFRV